MRPITKLRFTAAILFTLIAAIGCNPLTSAYFMLMGVDDKVPPKFKIGGDGKHLVRVAILTSSIQESRAELLGVERQLASAMVKALEIQCAANKERIEIVPVYKVENFKTNNPGWRTMPLNEVARKFEVDYLIDVEFKSVSLYEKDSRRQLFRGRSAVTLSVIDASKSTDECQVYQEPMCIEYPKARGPLPVDDDMTVERFRDTFIQRIATDLAWQLTSHVSTAGMMED
ncbi:MAG: hypothetical protein ACJ8C4_18530 [Gemmataceae bacterium]